MNYCLEWSQCFKKPCKGYSTNLVETLYPYHTTPQPLVISVLHFHQSIFRKCNVHLKSRGTYLCLASSTLCFLQRPPPCEKRCDSLLSELSSISFYAKIQTYIVSLLITPSRVAGTVIHVLWIVDHTTVDAEGHTLAHFSWLSILHWNRCLTRWLYFQFIGKALSCVPWWPYQHTFMLMLHKGLLSPVHIPHPCQKLLYFSFL